MSQSNAKQNRKPTFWRTLLCLISYRETEEDEGFILTEQSRIEHPQADDTASPPGKQEENRQKRSKCRYKKPIRTADYHPDRSKAQEKDLSVAYDLETNRQLISDIFNVPQNKDLIIRDFIIGVEPPIKAFAIFMEGIADTKIVNVSVLQPLMLLSHLDGTPGNMSLAEFVKNRLLPGNQVDIHTELSEIVDAVSYGATAIFLNGSAEALVVETKGWENRGVQQPTTEQVVRGPQESFSEVLRINTALIRKSLRTPQLTTEMLKLGVRQRTDCAIMYVDGIVNPSLVAEVKRRLSHLNMDYAAGAGVIEQFIEDHPFSLTPQVISTERPDRVVSMLLEGRVAIIVDGTPIVLVVPATFFTLLHSAEDIYLRWPYSTFLRLLRTVSVFVGLLLPGVYIAITTFHQEMLPTDLLLTIAGARDRVPFPTVVEVLVMEMSFEVIREAGIRIPGVIGTTIGIIGAIVLGQAAVAANIVSPVLIIIVAVTGLASFVIPNYSLAFGLRLIRFVYIVLGSVLGFFGISLGLFVQLAMTANMKSFGVPFLSPVGARTTPGRDVITRPPVWQQERRPDYLNTVDAKRQPPVSRGWVKQNEPKSTQTGQPEKTKKQKNNAEQEDKPGKRR